MRRPSRFFLWLWLGLTILCESIALLAWLGLILAWIDPVRLAIVSPIITLLLAGTVDSLPSAATKWFRGT